MARARHALDAAARATGGRSVTQLVKYEKARQALAEAHRVDEVKDIRDKHAAMQLYAQQSKDTQMMHMAAEIKIRAERRLGEMIREQKETVGLADGGEHGGNPRDPGSHSEPGSKKPTLAEAGISKKLSSHAQKLAAMPEEHFETAIATARETATAVSTSMMLRIQEEHALTEATKKEMQRHDKLFRWKRIDGDIEEALIKAENALKEGDACLCTLEYAQSIRRRVARLLEIIDHQLGVVA
jgi:hypothetical protein